jgi:hypothetical protein
VSTTVFPWRVQQLRITLFSPVIPPRLDGLWKSILTEEPPRSTRTPEGMEESGPVPNNESSEWLVTRSSAGRVDLVLAPPPEEQLGFGSPLLLLEPLPTYHERIADFGEKLLAAIGSAPVRLALGAVLMDPADSKTDGYSKMAKLLTGSVSLDPASSDFQYQINRVRTRSFQGEDVLLNRLTKWSVAYVQHVQVVIAPGVPAVTQAASALHACRLELDLSTDAARASLPQAQHLEILKSLFTFGVEIAANGDIP